MNILGAILLLIALGGCAVPTIFNPGGGSTNWGALSQGVGSVVNHK